MHYVNQRQNKVNFDASSVTHQLISVQLVFLSIILKRPGHCFPFDIEVCKLIFVMIMIIMIDMMIMIVIENDGDKSNSFRSLFVSIVFIASHWQT